MYGLKNMHPISVTNEYIHIQLSKIFNLLKVKRFNLVPTIYNQTRLGGFYFFYYSIVGTFMPYWNLYLQDQGFNYQEIGILSSIAIVTRFFAPLVWGWIADKSGKECY
jgi:hypothetical protein